MKKTILILGCLSTTVSWAGCERDDVDYYLSKGFSPDQITQLCASSAPARAVSGSAASSASQLSQQDQNPRASSPAIPATEPPRQQTSATAASDQENLLAKLRDMLKVKDLRVEGKQLLFKYQFRARYGEEDVFGNLEEVKPWMQVSIDLPSMRLIKSAQRIPVIRSGYVLLSGDMEQQVEDKDSYKAKQLEGIDSYLAEEVGQNSVKLKVHSDADANLAGSYLQELGLIYRRQ